MEPPPGSDVKTKMGLLKSPVGLAAGYDKVGRYVAPLAKLGFGYIVAGTFTLKPREGHPRPRVARRGQELALVNAMGMPNPGVYEFVRSFRRPRRRCSVLASIAGDDIEELAECHRAVQPVVDGVEVNLSCPTFPSAARLRETSFVKDMREMLAILEDAYGCPVDTEFTANFFGDEGYRINLVQCRPLPVNAPGMAAEVPADLRKDDLILEAHGAVIGQSRTAPVDRLIYVVPSVYGRLPVNERYAIARLIGRITHADEPRQPKTILLLGPGRWGTTTPSLGVPVSFAEINTISVLCEIVAMREDLVPDVSFGTHFFNELVEQDILYLALFPGRAGNLLNEEFLRAAPNKLTKLVPDAGARSDVVRVIDVADLADGRVLTLNANVLNQKVVCYLERDGSGPGGG